MELTFCKGKNNYNICTLYKNDYSLRNNHYGQKFYLINELDTFSCNSQKADKERANACNCLFFGGPLQLWDVIIYCIIHIRWNSFQFKYGSFLYKRIWNPIHRLLGLEIILQVIIFKLRIFNLVWIQHEIWFYKSIVIQYNWVMILHRPLETKIILLLL